MSAFSSPSPSPNSISEKAFTLVEMIAVVAIIGLMVTAVLPAITGLKRANNLAGAAYTVTGVIEQARAYAVTKNTYVFVGFNERDGQDVGKPGTGQILIITAGSKNGTREFGLNNSNLVTLSNTRVKGIHLENVIPNTGGLTRPQVSEQYRVANDAFAAQDTFSVLGTQFSKIIQIDPKGMTCIQSRSTRNPQWLEVGLAEAYTTSANYAAVVVDGVTGFSKIYRP